MNRFKNDSTKQAIEYELNGEHPIRHYLAHVKDMYANDAQYEDLMPQYIVTAIRLPTGTIEIAMSASSIFEKIDYILNAYDSRMCLKTNNIIEVVDVMVV